MSLRNESIRAALGIVLLVCAAILIARSHGPMRDVRIAGAEVRVLEPTHLPQIGTAFVFHGLTGNRVIMLNMGQWLAAQGLRVYLPDAPGHGRTPGHFTHAGALKSYLRILAELERSGEIHPQTTVLAGHSLGGEMAIRLADEFPAAATIASSPAPMVLPHRLPENLLIVGAQFDMPPMKQIAAEMIRAAGGQRYLPEDFAQKRAVRDVTLSWEAHASLILDSRGNRLGAAWAREALGAAGPPNEPGGSPFAGEILGLGGLALLFPLIATLLVRIFGASRPEKTNRIAPRPVTLILLWALAGLIAVSILYFWSPLQPLHLYGGSYLASFLLLVGAFAGLPLAFQRWRDAAGSLPQDGKVPKSKSAGPILAGVVLGVMAAFGFTSWLSWQLTDISLNGPRALAFVVLVPASLVYTYVEEVAVRSAGKSAARRLGFFFLLRAELLVTLLFGYFVLLSGEVLMGLMAPYFAIISLAQWLGADAIRRRTGSAGAAAVFGAILAAWFVAGVFPLA